MDNLLLKCINYYFKLELPKIIYINFLSSNLQTWVIFLISNDFFKIKIE